MRALGITLLLTVALAGGVAYGATSSPPPGNYQDGANSAPNPESHTCTARVIVFEDGTWMGGALRYDGARITRNWASVKNMPTYGFQPYYKGTPCRLIIR